MAKKANAPRKATNKGKKVVQSDIEITDEDPKEVPYPNPPGFKYVRAIVTYDDGSEPVEGIHLLSVDQIKRINKSK